MSRYLGFWIGTSVLLMILAACTALTDALVSAWFAVFAVVAAVQARWELHYERAQRWAEWRRYVEQLGSEEAAR